jgi:fucose permease
VFSLLLAIVYAAFVVMGLPDSLLGSAWPVIQMQIGAPISYAGFITMIISGGTIVASLLSYKLTKKLGAGLVVAISFTVTALTLVGFSFSQSFWIFCLFAVPYGLCVGSIDAAVNNYVAHRYNSRQLNWLHASWAVGAAISPFIMSFALSSRFGWSGGYQAVSIIQIAFAILVFASLPLWKKKTTNSIHNSQCTIHNDGINLDNEPIGSHLPSPTEPPNALAFASDGERSEGKSSLGGEVSHSSKSIFKTKNLFYMLFAFFCYSSFEVTALFWASSYLVNARGINAQSAAMFASFAYIGIAAGRFLSGIIANKLGNRLMMRIGTYVIFLGLGAILLAFSINFIALAGLIIIGLGAAPIYPAIIHSTPDNFGKENSQAIVGVQMAAAYTGGTFMPLVFGLIAQHISIKLYPVFLLLFIVIMYTMIEILNKKVKRG